MQVIIPVSHQIANFATNSSIKFFLIHLGILECKVSVEDLTKWQVDILKLIYDDRVASFQFTKM